MCEITKTQRRTFRDQDPPRICNKSTENLLKDELALSRSTPSSPTTLQRAISLEKCFSEPDFLESKVEVRKDGSTDEQIQDAEELTKVAEKIDERFFRELSAKVPSSCNKHAAEVISNGLGQDSYDGLTNGRSMAPVLGVPPPPPPAPHMGPDGLILPRKPYNPCLTSSNHKDLHRELLFNQKIGKNVLNQKSELQRALEKQREAAMRREAEKNREESFKDDPRTALQRAIEQRAKHNRNTEDTQPATPPNHLMTARAKLRPRMDSQ
ncbi:uncharacterized protein [Prorops nasuta]|uniref:uncharacterized protein isoform X1 n=1 Tax=Prorops nasuta TaxID=863751 RepID=UPI0034CF57D4